jgi:hypothetical protein
MDPDDVVGEAVQEWLLDHERLGAAPDLEAAAALAAGSTDSSGVAPPTTSTSPGRRAVSG